MTGNTIPIEFNGQVFVPLVPVELPEGTLCVLQLPAMLPPAPVTHAHRLLWDEISRQLESGPPPYATVDEAMQGLRGRS